MTSDEIYVLAGYVAGYRWKPPAQDWTKHLPTAVVSVSDCLTDFLPEDQDSLTEPWHTTLQDAVDASRKAPAEAETVHVLAMSVPLPGAPGLTTMIEDWIGDFPHPVRLNLAQSVLTLPGAIRGFEVLGFKGGRFHSWLCYGLLGEALDKFGVRVNGCGLLATLLEAQQVTNMANGNRSTHDSTPEDVTWFPALITEYETGQPVRSNSPVGHSSHI